MASGNFQKGNPAAFQKGIRGNPHGKPKIYYQMQKLARSHSTEAFEKLGRDYAQQTQRLNSP